MVKLAGFWKRAKNGIKKLGGWKNVIKKTIGDTTRVLSNTWGTIGKIAGKVAPIANLIPYGGIIAKAAESGSNFKSQILDKVANAFGSETGSTPIKDGFNTIKNRIINDFSDTPNTFHKSNEGPPGQPQGLADDNYTYINRRHPHRPRYTYYN